MSEQKNNLSCAFKLEEITYHLYLMCKCCGYIISYCGCVCELVDVNRCKRIYSFGLSGLRLRLGVHKEIEWNGMIIREWKGMKWNRIYLSKGKEWKRME